VKLILFEELVLSVTSYSASYQNKL